MRRLPFAAALLLALVAAQTCVWLDTPLPWMIGPLFATAGACMLGAPLHAPRQMRLAGQWALGTALGLFFTAPVVATLFALQLGVAGGVLLPRLSGADRCTAFFAMAVGGASKMATQGERYGARVDLVAAAHSLRIMLVVVILPFAMRWWSGHGLDLGLSLGPGLGTDLNLNLYLDLLVPAATQVRGAPLLPLLLVLFTCLGGVALQRRGAPNAWVIGPLLVAIALTASAVHLSRLPAGSRSRLPHAHRCASHERRPARGAR